MNSQELLNYFDYTGYPLHWYTLPARRDSALPAGPDNVSGHHRIRYAVAGGEAGLKAVAESERKPWLYVHGGPGGGFSPDDHRMVDPERFVPIMMVQRGGAGSGSEGVVEDVSVALLVCDFVDVLAHLGIASAYWAGGSWGTTLVLKLLLDHPELFVKLPTLRGLWIPSTRDLEFGYSRLNTHFPNWQAEQQAFFGFIAEQEAFFRSLGVWDEVRLEHEADLPLPAYQVMINEPHDNDALRAEAARRMWRWELISAKADPTPEDIRKIEASVADLSQARGFAATICHFAKHRFFLDIGADYSDCELWRRRAEIAALELPNGDLVHGSADSLCRPAIAERFAADTGYRLHMIEGAGHSRSEPGIRDALIRIDNGL